MCPCACVWNSDVKPFFEDLVQFSSSGPLHILLLTQPDSSANTVTAWLEFIGPADLEEARRDKPERSVYANDKPYKHISKSAWTLSLHQHLYILYSVYCRLIMCTETCFCILDWNSVNRLRPRSGKWNEQHIFGCSVRHTQILCFSLVERQPSNHLLSCPFPPGFLQLTGTIRHTDTVQRGAR